MSRAYETIRAAMERAKPQLVRFYEDTAAAIDPGLDLTEEMCRTLGRLAIASERLYLDSGIIRLALRRGDLEEFGETLLGLLDASFQIAGSFLSRYPALNFPLGGLGADLVRLAGAGLAGSKAAEPIISYCLTRPDADTVRFFIRFFASIGTVSPGSLPDIYRVMTTGMAGVPWKIYRDWLSRGADLLGSNRVEEGIDFLLLRSRVSRELLGMPHAVLDDTRSILLIYTSSISGRTLAVQDTEMSGFGVGAPYTDGRTVYLPRTMALFEDRQENERAFTALTAVCAAMVRFGTFGFDFSRIRFMDELRLRFGTLLPEILPNVRRQYAGRARTIRERPTGEVEAVFPNSRTITLLETGHEDFYYSFPTPDFIRELFVLTENARLEYLLGLRYPGLREDFTVLNRRLAEAERNSERVRSVRHVQLEAAVSLVNRYARTGEWNPPFDEPRILGAVNAMRKAFEKIRRPAASVLDSAETAFRLYTLFYEHFPLIPYCGEFDVRELFASPYRPEIVPELVLDASPELLAERPERRRFDDLQEPHERDVDLTSLTANERKAEEMRRAIIRGALRVYRYPEYDFTRGRYEQKHCTVYESVIEGGENERYRSILQEHRMIHRRLRKRFLSMQPEEIEVSRRWIDGDEVHLGDAVDYVTEILRGSAPDERIYQRIVMNRRDIAAAVVVDASSSTEEVLDGKRIIDVEITALALLASVLDAVGDSFAIYTYFSMGRRNVFMNILKEFDEAWDVTAQGRIAAVESMAANRDGCAVRHATAKLLDRPNRTKLLILLSDGIPADTGYGGTGGAEPTDYGIEDTRRAVVEARLAGVVPWCITIDRAAKRYIPRLYGDYHYTVVSDVEKLPEKLSKLYLRLTR